ncbi:hypothetical protein [Salinarimonas ramus]|uniref:Uncharacterized protein n=1 Tax=Salinarimonas ramus TaxID=690164 RepID=A0A917V851_9HYPH|nr:hypothetical protein [Salinarimonas ramus]GGK50422.1 hypothetical protein GCM10011322_41830 [Salinarimonas ramus]
MPTDPPRRENPDDARAREARRTLERVDRETETIGRSAGARMGQRMADHFAGRDAQGAGPHGETDPMEVWGKRIGRALAVPFFVFLLVWLGFTLNWW